MSDVSAARPPSRQWSSGLPWPGRLELPASWLTLSQVAERLGVHPGTVRSWSDQGMLPVHRTQGGHRRYLTSELELWIQSQRADGQTDAGLMMQNALRSIRVQVSEGGLAQEAWYARLDDEAREQYRRSGRDLLQGLMHSLNSNVAGAEAESLGYEYAARGRRCGLNSVDAVHAFLFFRNMVNESMLVVFESAAIRSPQAWSDMLRRMTAFTDAILVALLETYEAYERGTYR
jgi:excisionase family DNA binding protein